MAGLYEIMAELQALALAATAGIVVSNQETVSLGGTPTPADVITLTLTSSGISGSPVSLPYTVPAIAALGDIATALSLAINNNAALRTAGLKATPFSNATGLVIYGPPSLSVAWSYSLSPGATETVALAGAANGVLIAPGWPALPTLQEVARGGPALISVYDRKVGKNTTRWKPFYYGEVSVLPGLTTTLLNGVAALSPGGTATIVLGGTVVAGDAVSAVLTNYAAAPVMQAAQVTPRAGQSDTPSTVAAALRAAIAADAVLSTWVSVSGSGVNVTLTNLGTAPLALASYVGNVGSALRELGRRDRQFQMVCWARTQADRKAIVDPLSVLIANLQVDFLELDDGLTYADVSYANDFDMEDNTLEDVYRHDFLFNVDYPVTSTDALYSVIAPVSAFSIDQ